MTKTEIDRRLALAIGYTVDRVRPREHHFADGTVLKWIQVLNDYSRGDGPIGYSGWQRFEHLDPTVIWPIAERFDAFPYKLSKTWCAYISSDCYVEHNNATTATALAVIRYLEAKPMTDTARDAFEAWFTDGVTGARLARKDGNYVIMSAHLSWIAWQAATLAEREKRQPLTDADIISIAYDCNAMPEVITDSTLKTFVRAIEVAHGIKAK